MQISKAFFGAVTVALLSAAASSAQATAFDQSLSSPGGWFDGSGNPNGGFTVNTDNGYTIALRAKGRQNPSAIDSPTDIYSVPTGAEPSVPGRAWWNYEFSISCDLGCPGDPGGLAALLGASTMTVTDLTKGTSDTVSLLFWNDDSTWGASGQTPGSSSGSGSTTADPTAFIAQNSENPIFGAPMPFGYNEDDNDAYNFLITLVGTNANVLDTDSINVLVGSATLPVPEPVTISLFAAGLIGAATLRSRRKKKKA